ncbi:MAG: histidine phosphatase family protein [Bacteroidia bacterium]|nr:histidine phosphatase family protein [Bacteroidia bacterium]MDW8089300.1 histidine phosphatase family protein [Bacteroidia bacterium]
MGIILLMRHGKSDWEPEGVSDFNRPLSLRGIRDVLAQGQALLRQGYRPDFILSSPAIRAWHTAHLLAQICSLPHEKVEPHFAFYTETLEGVTAALRSLPETCSTVALIGHNPLWSELASRWAGKSIELSTAEIVGFHWEGNWASFPAGSFPAYLFYLSRTG